MTTPVPGTTPTETTPTDEIAAMRRLVRVLQPLDVAARDRVVGWLFDRYRITPEDELREMTRGD